MEILLTVIVAISAFVATNLDDLFLLTLFFARKDLKNSSVVVGQYFGVSLLMIICSLAYFSKFIIPQSYIALLGILTHCCRNKKSIEFKEYWCQRS